VVAACVCDPRYCISRVYAHPAEAPQTNPRPAERLLLLSPSPAFLAASFILYGALVIGGGKQTQSKVRKVFPKYDHVLFDVAEVSLSPFPFVCLCLISGALSLGLPERVCTHVLANSSPLCVGIPA
jgi:hypothetical protein